jgi:hypothetical protein
MLPDPAMHDVEVDAVCLICWTWYLAPVGSLCGDYSRDWQVRPCPGRLVRVTPSIRRFYTDYRSAIERPSTSRKEEAWNWEIKQRWVHEFGEEYDRESRCEPA